MKVAATSPTHDTPAEPGKAPQMTSSLCGGEEEAGRERGRSGSVHRCVLFITGRDDGGGDDGGGDSGGEVFLLCVWE